MKNWEVYYMNNDGRPEIVKSDLSYEAALKLSGQCQEKFLSTNIRTIKK